MRPGRLQRRAATPEAARTAAPMPIAGDVAMAIGPTATSQRELDLLAASRAVEATRRIRAAPESIQAVARAAVRARLAKKGTTIAEAWYAHREALADRPHDRHAATAWRAAIAAVADLVDPPPAATP